MEMPDPSKKLPNILQPVGLYLHKSRVALIVELSIVILFLALSAYGVISTPTIPLLLLGWISLWLRQKSWREIGLSRPRRWFTIIVLAVVIGSFYQMFSIFILVPAMERFSGEIIDLSQFESFRDNIPQYLTGLIMSWTLAAFGEELVFRGYILNRSADLFNRSQAGWITALLFTASVFGLAHIGQGIPGMMDNFIFAVLLGILYFAANRNLWLPILVHGIVDTIGFTLLYLGLYLYP
ncbi:MAG: CPBP family intramembrane metalloprotease [Chloroflexi bacterium]|nr:MAG: CPBP family intramembrane metalloprotease [Chloroflexota bacterium]